jgi:DNA-binding NarL/FixJ family response regulator/AraC-like DNA-binding protein
MQKPVKHQVILIVDEENLRLSWREAVLGCQAWKCVAAVAGGEAAVHLAGRLRPDLALVHLAGPASHRLEFIRRLRRSWPSLAIVLAAGALPGQAFEQVRQAGADAILCVPLTAGGLCEALAQFEPCLQRVPVTAQAPVADALMAIAPGLLIPFFLASGAFLQWDRREMTPCFLLRAAEESRYHVELLSDRCGCSARHLERLWKKYFGRLPKDWLHQVRMLAAAFYLWAGARLSDVSAKLQYAHLSGFASAFKKYFRLAPAHFAQAIRTRSWLEVGKSYVTGREIASRISRISGVTNCTPSGDPLLQCFQIGEILRQARDQHSALKTFAAPRTHEDAGLAHTTDQFTHREEEVLLLLLKRLHNKAISNQLGISLATTKTHVQHVLAKCGIHSRRQLTQRASAG